ncbi:hypothetical protein D3C84_368730 [compost metagenome]
MWGASRPAKESGPITMVALAVSTATSSSMTSWARLRRTPSAVATAGPIGIRSSQRLTSRQTASINSANSASALATGWVT